MRFIQLLFSLFYCLNLFSQKDLNIISNTNINKTKVFLFAGQSNMDGRGDYSMLSSSELEGLAFAQKNIKFYYKGTANNSNPIIIDAALSATDPWPFVKQKFKIDKCFGPELFFGIELSKSYPENNFLFIKRSEGGTSLYGAWNPNWTYEKAKLKQEEHRNKLFNDFIVTVDKQLIKLPEGSYEIVGMLWVQGESDSGQKHGPLPSEKYSENLTSLIEKVRNYYDIENMPFLMLGVGSNKIISSMQNVSQKLSNVELIHRSLDPKSENYTPRYKHLWNGKPANHYNYIGMKKIGKLFFERYKEKFSSFLSN